MNVLYHSVLLTLSKISTMKVALLFIGTLLLACHTVDSYSCAKCSKVKCPTLKQCKGGTVLDFCRCCHKCAKVEGETCGGYWNGEGRCDSGLRCVIRDWRPEARRVGTCKPGKVNYIKMHFISQNLSARPGVPI